MTVVFNAAVVQTGSSFFPDFAISQSLGTTGNPPAAVFGEWVVGPIFDRLVRVWNSFLSLPGAGATQVVRNTSSGELSSKKAEGIVTFGIGALDKQFEENGVDAERLEQAILLLGYADNKKMVNIEVGSLASRLCILFLIKEDLPKAERYCSQERYAYGMTYSTLDHPRVARGNYHLGNVLKAREDFPRAIGLLEQARDAFLGEEDVEENQSLAFVYRNLSELSLLNGDIATAGVYAENGLRILLELHKTRRRPRLGERVQCAGKCAAGTGRICICGGVLHKSSCDSKASR